MAAEKSIQVLPLRMQAGAGRSNHFQPTSQTLQVTSNDA
jgi:hypothetical protein